MLYQEVRRTFFFLLFLRIMFKLVILINIIIILISIYNNFAFCYAWINDMIKWNKSERRVYEKINQLTKKLFHCKLNFICQKIIYIYMRLYEITRF